MKERPPGPFRTGPFAVYLSSLTHFWLATVQEVLHADWQLDWHSPHAVPWPERMQGF